MAPILIATLMRPEGETGVQTHFRFFHQWLLSRSRTVQLVTPYSTSRGLVYPVFALRRLIDPWHKPLSVWWYRYWHAFFLQMALRKALSDGQRCVVYAQCPLSAEAALRARRNAGQRVVMVVHFNVSQADEWVGKGMLPAGSQYAKAMRQFEADLLPRLDGIVNVSGFMRDSVLARIPAAAPVASVVVPNFVPDPGTEVAIEPIADLMMVGTLEPRKNQRYALEIVAAAAAAGHRLTLALVGDGPDRAMLERLVHTLGITEQVKFLGFVRNAAHLFNGVQACLHVALIENLPLSLIEAMARGRPVFAMPTGGIPEVFEEGVSGAALPSDNAAGAASILIDWLSDTSRLKSASSAARSQFAERFESDVAAAKLLAFLDASIERGI